MIEGVFRENTTDLHVALRRELLSGERICATPKSRKFAAASIQFLTPFGQEIISDFIHFGIAVIQLDRPLDNEQFIDFGSSIGTLIPEHDPAVKAQVENKFILNLVSAYENAADPSLQPLSKSSLTLHTECSARPAAAQPRYIILMCCQPGDQLTSAQTIVSHMEAIGRRLTASDKALLGLTRYQSSHDGPFFLRYVSSRCIFSFRDFLNQPLLWAHEAEAPEPEEVNEAIRRLLTALYDSASTIAIEWSRGLLAIIDNTRVFHGRTQARPGSSTHLRHLKRLRVL